MSLSPTLSWNTAAFATAYDVQVATDSSFTNVVRSASGLAATSWAVSPSLTRLTTYYWRARGTNLCTAGNWSAAWRFRTASK